MDRILPRRLAFRTALTALLSGLAMALLAPGTAHADPTPSPSPRINATPNSVRIEGSGLAEPLVITSEDQPDEFDSIYNEVIWMNSRPSVTGSPGPDKLGPKYTVTILVNGVPKQVYDLYPLATGGPRAYRSDKQPDKRKTTAAWLYGHLSMPTTLRAAGVPVPGVSLPPGAGGAGGGSSTGDREDIGEMFGEWRGVVALNGALVLLIAAGLFGIAFRIRRKI